MSRTQTFAVVMTLGLLSACAMQRTVYERPGITEEQRKQDQATCIRAAISRDAEWRVLQIVQIDRGAYARCMENRGYVAHRQ